MIMSQVWNGVRLKITENDMNKFSYIENGADDAVNDWKVVDGCKCHEISYATTLYIMVQEILLKFI